jgi:predicted Rossmann-fold nucleotide-binding protein
MTELNPTRLYSASDLIEGFNPWDLLGYTLSRDFSIFRQFVLDGGPVPASLAVRTAQADHDAVIADALRQFLKNIRRPLVGFMGGHGVPRDSGAYADVARLSRHLARKGFLLVTGGGPGVMEAAHLGVAFSASPDGALDAAIKSLSQVPGFPGLDKLFEPDGSVSESKIDALVKARNWLKVALEVRAMAPAILPLSLAIPTWLYGAEPTMPFATHYAKYYQNSIREEALVNNSRAGIIYGQGGGGTMREVFQDVERNYYATAVDGFTPMIFFDRGNYWTQNAVYDGTTVKVRGIKLDATVPTVLEFGLRSGPMKPDEVKPCLEKVKFTADADDFAAITDILSGHSGAAERNLNFALAAEPMKVTSARINRA